MISILWKNLQVSKPLHIVSRSVQTGIKCLVLIMQPYLIWTRVAKLPYPFKIYCRYKWGVVAIRWITEIDHFLWNLEQLYICWQISEIGILSGTKFFCFARYLTDILKWLKRKLEIIPHENAPTFRHTAVNCGFLSFDMIQLGLFWEILKVS